MSELTDLLQTHYRSSSFQSIAALAKAAQQYGRISPGYISHLLQGRRKNPTSNRLLALAKALELSPKDTNRLFRAAGLSPLYPEEDANSSSQFQQVVDALSRLKSTPGLQPEVIQAVTNSLLLLVEGVRTAAGAAPAPPTTPALTPGEALVDFALGEIQSGGSKYPRDLLFLFLGEAARDQGWEIKRKIAEALPGLVQIHPDSALQLAVQLRTDYHFDYKADIRRRVVEAVPALYRYRPQEALKLLRVRERDEIYIIMAIVEALHDLQVADPDPYLAGVRWEEPAHQEAIAFLRRLLRETREDPATALATMQAHRNRPETLAKICIVRLVPRLLPGYPGPALDLLIYFSREEAGQYIEHKNIRRAVSKAVPDILETLDRSPGFEGQVGQIIQALARDPDIHVRRALADYLNRLAEIAPEAAVGILDKLLYDQDSYVRERAGRAVLALGSRYPDQARAYYTALFAQRNP